MAEGGVCRRHVYIARCRRDITRRQQHIGHVLHRRHTAGRGHSTAASGQQWPLQRSLRPAPRETDHSLTLRPAYMTQSEVASQTKSADFVWSGPVGRVYSGISL